MKLINLINEQAKQFLKELTNGKDGISKARTNKNKSKQKKTS